MTNLVTVPQGGTMLDVLAERYRAAFDKMEEGCEQWIEGTLELAAVILEAREIISGDKEYGRWLTANRLEHLHPNKRMALVGIGEMERKSSGTGRKLLEDNFGLALRTIWEKKATVPKRSPTSSGKGPRRNKSGYAKRNYVPTVMQDETPVPPPARPKQLSEMFLTPEQVDPDFKGTPLEFTTKYGHVLLHTKDQIEQTKRQEALMAWLGTVADFERTGRSMLAALAKVDPATVAEWAGKPAKAEKLRGWCDSIQVACEAISKLCPAICSTGKVP